jgi:hypothetical protein
MQFLLSLEHPQPILCSQYEGPSFKPTKIWTQKSNLDILRKQAVRQKTLGRAAAGLTRMLLFHARNLSSECYHAYNFSLRAGKLLSGIDWQPRSVLRLEVTRFHDNRSPPLVLLVAVAPNHTLIVPKQQTIAVTLPPAPMHLSFLVDQFHAATRYVEQVMCNRTVGICCNNIDFKEMKTFVISSL